MCRSIQSKSFLKLKISSTQFEIIHRVGSCQFMKSAGLNVPHVNRMLSLSALVVYCTKSRRAERYWQKTLLQMEEMESQIREEIRKGVFTQEPTNAHINTLTHTVTSYKLSCQGCLEVKFFGCIDMKKKVWEARNIDHIYLLVHDRLGVHAKCVCLSVLSWMKWEGDTTFDRFVPSKPDS